MNGVSALSTLFSGIDFGSRQGYAVARLALDQAKAQGEAAVELVEASAQKAAQPVSDPTGPSGHRIDLYA